jgi:predicted phosphodiesterase
MSIQEYKDQVAKATAEICEKAGLKKGDILLHGHTHVPVAVEFGDGNVYINPGSVSIPKENSPKSYILYENRSFSFCELYTAKEYKKFEI